MARAVANILGILGLQNVWSAIQNFNAGLQINSRTAFGVQAFVIFDGTGTIGTNMTIIKQHNVSTVFKNGTGDFTITMTAALADANYIVGGSNYSAPGSGGVLTVNNATPPTTSVFRILTFFPQDSTRTSVMVVGT